MKKIIQANIDRFKLMLEEETDPSKRSMIHRLLTEQEAELKKGDEPAKKSVLISLFNPHAPMRWFDVQRSLRRGISPAGLRATARKNKSVSTPLIEYSNFQIGIKRCNRNRQPFVRWPLMLKHKSNE